MVIYTVLPPDEVMSTGEGEPPHYFTIDMDGRTFVMELADGHARIVRLLSTNPNDYLNPEWQPGKQVGFTIPGMTHPGRSNPTPLSS
ncbi:MAG TPA: hypothetical protein GX512_00105 [Firmicutes bacterium]|nr:hypothetical protein [Candidatus Fermentithermobacillaceae bacterium]